MDVIDKVAPLCGEKIIISAEFSQTDVAAALMCLGEELTPERWEQVKAAPSKKQTSAVAALYYYYFCSWLFMVCLATPKQPIRADSYKWNQP